MPYQAKLKPLSTPHPCQKLIDDEPPPLYLIWIKWYAYYISSSILARDTHKAFSVIITLLENEFEQP